jgi:arylsulfatase A-like enzyme
MNVVVVVAHGLNCHWLGPYGNEWVNTPAFDSLAGEAITFDGHFANEPSAGGFSTSCLARLWPAVRDRQISTTLVDDRRAEPAASFLWNNVFRTDPKSFPKPGDALAASVTTAIEPLPKGRPWLLWIDTDRLVPPWDFEFETYQQYAEESAGFIEARSTDNEEPIDEPALATIDREDDALWHRLHNSFAAAVTSFDAELATIVEAMRKRGLDRSATLIVTSSFGWPLGEHGVVGPDESSLHEELVHLPLIVRLPDAREAMRRVSAFTQPSDLPAAILEMLDGKSEARLNRLMVGSAAEARQFCRISRQTQQSIRSSDWAYLAAAGSRTERLYRKPDDTWEVNDLAARHTDECDQLQELLRQEDVK